MVKCFSLLSGLILIFSSCREKEILLFDNADRKLVLTCFLTPGTGSHEANLSWSSFERDYEKRVVKNALVELIDPDGKRVQLIYDSMSYTYGVSEDSMLLVPGKTYRMEALAEGQKVSSLCIIPSVYDPQVESSWDTVRVDVNRLVWTLKLKWKDEPGVTNFSRVGATLVGEGFNADGSQSFSFYNFFQERGRYLFSEEELRDGYHEVELTAYIDYPVFIPQYFAFEIRNTDEPYYRFHRQLQDLGWTAFDIFPEHYRVYSNVAGGLGVFCSSTRIVEVTEVF